MACVRICITGPESTGKSSLTKHLSAYFGFPYVDEKARSYLNSLNRAHTFEDLNQIAQLQQKAISEASKKVDVLFCDTDLLTIKIWAQDKYKKEILFVEEYYLSEKSDLYLLCYPDLEWQPDPQREDEERLKEIYQFYLSKLTDMDANYVVVNGQGDDRRKLAEEAVKEFLKVRNL